jgi:molybdate transport system permease protein
MDWDAIRLTLRLAAATTAILLVLGLPLAWWLARSSWRWKFLIEAVVALPIVLPPTVLGFYVLMAIGPHGWIGRGYEALFDQRLPFSFYGLLIGSVFYSLPFAVQPFTAAFATVDGKLLDVARSLGADRRSTFLRVAIPLAWPGILTGIILSFAHTVGEFGVVLMIGGNIPGATRTVSIAIYDDVQALDYAAAHQTSLVLLVFSFLVLAVTYGRSRRIIRFWR